jgi:hypothetical protein
MDESLFRVVFTGALTGEFDEPEARAKFSKLFRLNEKNAAKVFSGHERVIKNNIAEAEAMNFMIRVLETGWECYVQEVPDANEPDYEEKRSSGERRIRFRRGPRPGAIIPDRRLVIRRRRDKRQFAELKRLGKEIPLAFQSYPADAANEEVKS